jgi:mannose-6-phosphate isomerase
MRMTTEKLKAVDGPAPGEARISAFRLQPWFSPRVWGRHSLQPWYAETGVEGNVGEAWMTGPACVVDTGEHKGKTLDQMAKEFPGQLGNGEYPLLVKMLFPNDKLSVQVHPDDAEAQKLGHKRGKTECWYVLEAAPEAKVALGLKAGVGIEDLRRAAGDGTIEELLEMVPVEAGDMIFVDAGTVHAIEGGVAILEVQQTCDVTYRLWDYGRDRELHLDDGLAIVKLKTSAGKIKPIKESGFTRLIETEYFVVDRFDLTAGEIIEMPMDGIGCVAGLRGTAAVNAVEVPAGYAVVVPVGSVALSSKDGASVLRCWEPGKM